MKRIPRPRALLAALLLLALSLGGAPTSEAIPVTDAIHIAETIRAAIDRYIQLARTLEMQLQNLERIDLESWNIRDVYGVLAGFAQFLDYAESLVYTDLVFLEPRWFETFHTDLIDLALYPEGADGLALMRHRRTLDTLWGIMRGVRLQANNILAGQDLLDDIKDQGLAVLGNLDAAQVQVLIGAYEAEELAQIRQLLAAQTNALLVTSAAEHAARAQHTEELITWLGLRGPLPEVGGFASEPI